MHPHAETWMRRAVELAERGRGHVEPNPLVGAVLVKEERIIGEGYHERFGHAHAEINALRAAGDAARSSTLYVTLEPCCHHGKTPPCTGALIRAGVAEVIAALEDPFPQVAGQGASQLREGGISITFGLCAQEARRQNAPYLKLLATGMPYVHAKWAMTLDGKIASRTGDSKWISNEASRRIVHQLRGRMDAVVVGFGTALADNPLLTARPPGPRVPCRVVLDAKARLPSTHAVLTSAREVPTQVVIGRAAAAKGVEDMLKAGCEVMAVAETAPGRLDLSTWLRVAGAKGWTNVLVEGGSQVLGSFRDLGAIDEAHVFLAPRLVGGAQALTPMGGLGADTIGAGCEFVCESMEMIEGDVYWRGRRR